MISYKPGPFLKACSDEELRGMLERLEEDLAKTPLNHHSFASSEDAVALVKKEIQIRKGV